VPTHSALSDAARDAMITENLGLAHQLARRFLHRGEPLDDLVQVASVALVKSVDRFDESRGVDFAAFATRTIIGELKRHFRDKGWAVRASRRVQELYLELGHATSTLVQQLGRSPTVAELAQATGSSEEAVLEAIEAGQGYRAASIDAPRTRTIRSPPVWANGMRISTRWRTGRSWPRFWHVAPA
jgi:RNA polymerase sigma-B factor